MIGIGLVMIETGCGSQAGGVSESKSLLGGSGGGSDSGAGNSGGVTVTNIYSQPKQLGTGDLLYVDLNSSKSLDFAGVESQSEFIFVVANTSSNSSNFSVQINGDLSEAEFDLEEDPTLSKSLAVHAEEVNDITEQFHESLRLKEKELETLEISSEAESLSMAKSISTGVSPSISEGSEQSFKVLASLSSTSSSVSVDAVAECVRNNVAFYVDKRVTTEMLSSAEVDGFCRQFDETVSKEEALFGSLSDVNNDGKVIVLFTPQVNKLGALGGGIVTGFFNATDLYSNSSSNAASNHMEILYIMVPDPKGEYGATVSKSFAMSNLIPAVLPHELQHAISYNQHVFVNKGSSEEAWLNEGLSHLAEDMMGQNQENPSRYALYLQNPSAYPLTTSKSPNLATRGGAYLFLRYLYEQAENPKAFLAKLLQSSNTGVRGIEAAFGGRAGDFDQFGEFFLRWSAALAMTDRGVSQDRRFTYQPRVADSATGNLSGVCLSCSAQDNRGTKLSGVSVKSFSGSQSSTTASSAARFYKVSNVSGKLDFSSSGSTDGFGILIRTK